MAAIHNTTNRFGEPDLAGHGLGWSVRQVLAYLKARPGMYLTHIIMGETDDGACSMRGTNVH